MKYYAVKVGRESPAITTTWAECTALVTGYSGAIFKSFNNINDALAYLELDKSLFDFSTIVPALNTSNKEQSNALLTPKMFTVPVKADLDMSNVYLGQNHEHKCLIEKQLLTLFLLKEEIIIYTDGSCLNQGNSDKNLWTAGSGIYIPEIDLKIGLKIDGIQTNNRAEMYPIIWILEILYNIIQSFNKGPSVGRIIIYSDSTYAMNIYGKNVKNLDLWTSLRAILKKLEETEVQITFTKVIAHSGIYGNEMADRIADHMASPPTPNPEPSGYAF